MQVTPTGPEPLEMSMLVPVISAIGFGVQQFLQVLVDPVASGAISVFKDKRGRVQPDGSKLLPGGISDVDAKKVLLGLASIGLGGIITLSAGSIRILGSLKVPGLEQFGFLDLFVTALTISAGTEGANTVVKLAQYVKDAVKTRTPPSVAQNSPVPQSPSDLAAPAGRPLDPESLAELADTGERSLDVSSRAKEEDYGVSA